jgi:hypothetical protein
MSTAREGRFEHMGFAASRCCILPDS